MTTAEAKKIVREFLDDRKLSYTKLTAMLRTLPDMYVLLREIVAEANEYETYQFDENYEFGPTTTIGRAQSIINKIEGRSP